MAQDLECKEQKQAFQLASHQSKREAITLTLVSSPVYEGLTGAAQIIHSLTGFMPQSLTAHEFKFVPFIVHNYWS